MLLYYCIKMIKEYEVTVNKKSRKKVLIGLAIGIIALGALGGGIFLLNHRANEEVPKKDTLPGEEKKSEEEKAKQVEVIDLNSKNRPYAVMINNNSAVWPYQSGLNDAYIIYEMLVEGGITREMALFKDSKTAKIQSIRSSRHYFLDYALENDAIYVHWGWSPKAQSDIYTLGINNINGLSGEGAYFGRDKTVKAAYEHTGYTTMPNLERAAANYKYRVTTDEQPLLAYSAESLDMNGMEGVIEAKYVEIPYSSGYVAKFYYDEETKEYKRSQNYTELIDYTSKERITTHNIIVYNVGYYTMDNYGRQDMKNIGSGTGYFVSEGKAIPIKWEKKTRAGKTQYMYASGEELLVNDGRTYIGLEPTGQTAKIYPNLP